MKLLLISHGGFANGLLSSYEMIAGRNKNITAISLTDDGIGDFSANLQYYLAKNNDENILILCDVKGGSPFNQAYQQYLTNPNKIRIITGMNLPMLIEIGLNMLDEENLDHLFDLGIKTGIISIEGVVEDNSDTNNDENDNIF